jgi:DNA-directed RNA polymerase subunit beta
MNFKLEPSGKHRVRRNYSRVKLNADLPGLIDIQLESFEWFKTYRIRELFDYINPIENHNGNIKMYFGEYEFETPVHDIAESKRREVHYSSKLKINVKLVFEDTGEVKEESSVFGRYSDDDPRRYFCDQWSATRYRYANHPQRWCLFHQRI